MSMSEIEDIADTEFDELHIDMGKLDTELNVAESCTDGQGMLEELLGVVLATAQSKPGMAHCDGGTALGNDSYQGSSPLSHTPTPGIYLRLGVYYTNVHSNPSN